MAEAQYPTNRPTISASKLIKIGGEKGAPGCQRKLAGEYLFGAKQASSDALVRGSALHLIGEVYQNTGEVIRPESEEANLFQAGRHHLEVGTMAVEYEHVGELPCGTPFVAYIDARDHQEAGGVFRLRDLKTTSNPRYALVSADDASEDNAHMRLAAHLQAAFYAYLLLCVEHWFAPPLPEGHFGPKHWQRWVPAERIPGKEVLLQWVYFKTRGRPVSWVAEDCVSEEAAQQHYDQHIAPLVLQINLIYLWRERNPDATIQELGLFLRDSRSCKGKAMWCGPGEQEKCDFGSRGEPIEQLVQLTRRPKRMNAKERLAAKKAERDARMAAGKAVKPQTEEVDVSEDEAPEPAPEPAPEQPKAKKAPTKKAATKKTATKKAATKKAPTGVPTDANGQTAGINPPEVKEALAKLPAAVQKDDKGNVTVQVSANGPASDLGAFTTEQLLAEIIRRAGVSK